MSDNNIIETEVSEVMRTNIGDVYGPRTFSRHIPDYRDGLKPVIRRVLLVLYNEKQYGKARPVKSAAIVGETIKSYHPHGDASVYDTMVKHANRFSISYPYIKGLGNWGYITGDPAASMRYTECTASDFAYDVILQDITKESIDWKESEFGKGYPDDPIYLPSRVPLILVNGSQGIAEAFTSNIPPHNIYDICDICIKYVQNKNISVENLARDLRPDYPTGCLITNGVDLPNIYKTGEGKIVVKANIEIDNEHSQLIIRDLPYGITYDTIKNQINVARKEKNNIILSKIIKDYEEKYESIEINPVTGKREKNSYWRFICDKNANLYEILNELYKVTHLKVTYPVSFRLNFGYKSSLVNLKDIIRYWYETRVKTITRNLVYKKSMAEYDKHIIDGLIIFTQNSDSIVEFIKKSNSKKEIVEELPKKYPLSQIQSKKISECPLHFLTKLSREELNNELENLNKIIDDLNHKLNTIDSIIIEELKEIARKYGKARKTSVIMSEEEKDIKKSISYGVVLLAANSYGIFDSNAIFNSKNILNGLKVMKLDDGRVFKNIVKAVKISNELAGIIVFYEDGQARKIPLKDIPTFNTWIHISDNIPLTHVVPYYTEKDKLIIINKEGLTGKFVEVSNFSTRKSNATKIMSVFNTMECTHIIGIASDGTYWNIEVGIEGEDLPYLNTTSIGVKTPFSYNVDRITGIEFAGLDIHNSTKLIVQYVHDDTGFAFNYIPDYYSTHMVNPMSRTNKPKKLFDSANLVSMELTGLSNIDETDKNSIIVMIGRNNISKLDIKNFKGQKTIKKIMIHSLAMLQYGK